MTETQTFETVFTDHLLDTCLPEMRPVCRCDLSIASIYCACQWMFTIIGACSIWSCPVLNCFHLKPHEVFGPGSPKGAVRLSLQAFGLIIARLQEVDCLSRRIHRWI
jgi:hypothetical protein